MIYELIFTSVPRGLKSSQSGFTTAAATVGMSRATMAAMERLSGYGFHFNLSDANASLNPINFAHTRISIGKETSSVLSRVGFAGADYSGRANKIAHHFLIPPGEKVPQGPAWMLLHMRDGTLRTTYDDPPQELPPRTVQDLVGETADQEQQATAWKAVAGDAGWGGALVRAFRINPRVPAFVIFEPGSDILPLFAESLALLPPEERWEVCFATYYSANLPVGTQCHWRGILAGSVHVAELGRYPDATVIDLTHPLGEPSADTYTESARLGQILPAPTNRAAKMVSVAETLSQPAEKDPSAQEEGGLYKLTDEDQAQVTFGNVAAKAESGTSVYSDRRTGPGYDRLPSRWKKIAGIAAIVLLVATNAWMLWMFLNARIESENREIKIASLQSEIEKANEQLQAAAPQLAIAKTQPGSATNEVADLKAKNSELQTKHQELTSKYADIETAFQKLKKKYENLQKKLNKKTAPVSSMPTTQPRETEKPKKLPKQLEIVKESKWKKYKCEVLQLSTEKKGVFVFAVPRDVHITAWADRPDEYTKNDVSCYIDDTTLVYKYKTISLGKEVLLKCTYNQQQRTLTLEAGDVFWKKRDELKKYQRALFSVTVGMCDDGSETLYLMSIPLKSLSIKRDKPVPVMVGVNENGEEIGTGSARVDYFAWPGSITVEKFSIELSNDVTINFPKTLDKETGKIEISSNAGAHIQKFAERIRNEIRPYEQKRSEYLEFQQKITTAKKAWRNAEGPIKNRLKDDLEDLRKKTAKKLGKKVDPNKVEDILINKIKKCDNEITKEKTTLEKYIERIRKDVAGKGVLTLKDPFGREMGKVSVHLECPDVDKLIN